MLTHKIIKILHAVITIIYTAIETVNWKALAEQILKFIVEWPLPIVLMWVGIFTSGLFVLMVLLQKLIKLRFYTFNRHFYVARLRWGTTNKFIHLSAATLKKYCYVISFFHFLGVRAYSVLKYSWIKKLLLNILSLLLNPLAFLLWRFTSIRYKFVNTQKPTLKNGYIGRLTFTFTFRKNHRVFSIVDNPLSGITLCVLSHDTKAKLFSYEFGRVYRLLRVISLACLTSGYSIYPYPIGRVAYLDPSGIEAPGRATNYFWDSTEFGQRLRTNYFSKTTNYYQIYNHRSLTLKTFKWDPREQFLANVLQPRWDLKIWLGELWTDKTKWERFCDRAEKIGTLLVCFVGLFFFFNACDNADIGMWTPPGPPGEWMFICLFPLLKKKIVRTSFRRPRN